MALDIAYINAYGYSIDASALKDNVKNILNNAAQKNAPETIFEEMPKTSNTALLFEYTQAMAKSNAAQQLVLDNNLKETLKFLNSEAAKKMSKKGNVKAGDIIDEIITDNDISDFESNEQTKEEDDIDNLELFGIEIEGKKNIFAA